MGINHVILTVRNIQAIQMKASEAGYLSEPNTAGIGLLGRGEDYVLTQAASDADYKARQAMQPNVPLMSYKAKPVLGVEDFPALQQEYAKRVQTESSESYDFNGPWRVILKFNVLGKKPFIVAAESLVSDTSTVDKIKVEVLADAAAAV